MVSPHIASTLRPRNVTRGSRLGGRDAFRPASSGRTTRSGTARVTVCPIIGTACNRVHMPDTISVSRSPATPPSTLPRSGPVMKPRLKPSRTVDITRLSAPVGAWVSQTIRQLGIRLKLNPLRDVIGGKRLVVVDDSIVRGNTQRALVRMLREAGAVEVHIRISSPPVQWPCFYGIDFASRAELIATGANTEEICRSIGADSLGYVSLDGLVAATNVAKDKLCRACFDGIYPIELPLSERLGKNVLEEPVRTDVDGLETVVAGIGAADALSRP